MGQPKSPHSFPDCRAFMNKAAEAEIGTRAIFREKGHAKSFQLRCYTARNREQIRNKKMFEEGDVLYGASTWDTLTFKIQKLADGRYALSAIHDDEAALKALDAEIEDIEP